MLPDSAIEFRYFLGMAENGRLHVIGAGKDILLRDEEGGEIGDQIIVTGRGTVETIGIVLPVDGGTADDSGEGGQVVLLRNNFRT